MTVRSFMDELFVDVAHGCQACLVGFLGLITLLDMMLKLMVCWLWLGMEPNE